MAVPGDAPHPSPAGAVPAAPDGPPPLPEGFGVRPGPGFRSLDGGRVLLGGSPLRLLALRPRATALVNGWLAGTPVGPSVAERRLARRLVTSTLFLPQPGGPAPSPDQVTVVVPVRDRPSALAALLASLGDLTTVVVDDGSDDPDRTEAVARAAGAAVRRLAENRGPAAARNAGLADVRTPFVAFVDSDCRPAPGWLTPLLAQLADPSAAAAAPRILPPEGGRGWRDRYEAVRSPLDRGPVAGSVRPRSRIPFVPTAALVVRRAALGDPCFDERLRGGEDVDLVWRLVRAGWAIRYVPEAVVHHRRDESLGASLARRAFYGATAGPLARRHPDDLAPLSLSAWTAAAALALVARRPAVAGALTAVSAGLFARRLRPLVDHPWSVAARVVGEGTLRSTVAGASGLARVAGPLALAALLPRRTRPVAAAVVLLPALADWWATRPDLDPLRYTAAHAVDDAAYGAGVWLGCLRAKTLRPLRPDIVWRSPPGTGGPAS